MERLEVFKEEILSMNARKRRLQDEIDKIDGRIQVLREIINDGSTTERSRVRAGLFPRGELPTHLLAVVEESDRPLDSKEVAKILKMRHSCLKDVPLKNIEQAASSGLSDLCKRHRRLKAEKGPGRLLRYSAALPPLDGTLVVSHDLIGMIPPMPHYEKAPQTDEDGFVDPDSVLGAPDEGQHE